MKKKKLSANAHQKRRLHNYFLSMLFKFEVGTAGTCENGWKLKSWSYSDVPEVGGWVWKDVAKFYYGYYRSNRSALGEPKDGCEGYNSHHSEYMIRYDMM